MTLIVPSVLLMYGSDWLGEMGTLLAALAFPLGWGVRDYVVRRRWSAMAIIGGVSTLLTGGIGLLRLDAGWLAVKEAGVSAVIGLAVAVSAWSRRPLIHALVFDAALLDTPRLEAALAERGTGAAFEARLRTATLLLAASFGYSALANYVLTRAVVTSAAGSAAFNEELGRLNLLGWPVITLPSMVMVSALLWWLAREAHKLSGLSPTDLLAGPPPARR